MENNNFIPDYIPIITCQNCNYSQKVCNKDGKEYPCLYCKQFNSSVAKDFYCGCATRKDNNEEYKESYKVVKRPKEITKGDMIKIIFPNAIIIYDDVYEIYEMELPDFPGNVLYSKEWWESPYIVGCV